MRVRHARATPLTISAVIAAGIHLFPFRTEKLSPPAPMVLGGQPPGRVGRRRITFEERPRGALRVSGPMPAPRSLSRQPGIERLAAGAPDPPTGGCVSKSAASRSRGNGLTVYSGSVTGFAANRRARRPARAGRARRRARGATRRAAAAPVGLELALRRQQQVDERGGHRPSTNSSARCSKPPMPRARPASRRRRTATGLHDDVAVRDVRELVRKDPLELGRAGARDEAGADGDASTRCAPRPADERARKRSVMR